MGHPVGNLTRDEVLDNVTLYWLTNTGVSSGRLYWENPYDFFGTKNVNIPAAATVFPKELYRAPRSWAERAYPSSSTSTRSTGAATSPPGRSRSCSPKRSARVSGHCVSNPSPPSGRGPLGRPGHWGCCGQLMSNSLPSGSCNATA
jgi:hypothetical protein